MTASELATFLKERLPIIRQEYQDSRSGVLYTLDKDYFDALDAAVGLLRKVADAASKPLVVMKKRFPPNVSYTVDYLKVHQENSKVLADVLATLRLVVGEKEPA